MSIEDPERHHEEEMMKNSVFQLQRKIQAKRLWDKGFGKAQGYPHFEAYLASIPETPSDLVVDDRFPHLVLVDRRVHHWDSCRLLLVKYDLDYSIQDYDPRDPEIAKDVYWIRIQTGGRFIYQNIDHCRRGFEDNEFGLTAREGLAFYAQKPHLFQGIRMMVCLGSRVNHDDDEFIVFLSGGDEPALWAAYWPFEKRRKKRPLQPRLHFNVPSCQEMFPR